MKYSEDKPRLHPAIHTVAWAFNVAEQNKVAVNWGEITVAAIAQGCDVQRANHSDWHADLSAYDLTRYLKTSTEPRWWTQSAIMVTVESFLKADEALHDDDGMFSLIICWYGLANSFQFQLWHHSGPNAMHLRKGRGKDVTLSHSCSCSGDNGED